MFRELLAGHLVKHLQLPRVLEWDGGMWDEKIKDLAMWL